MGSIKECFLICPIGERGSRERKRSDKLLKYIVAPIANKLGYKVVRADTMPKSGIITSQILNMIIEAPLVIADLTDGNPNVFYELALRHAVNKPYIQVIEHEKSIPFDVSAVRTISYNLDDLDAVDQTKSEVSKQILAIDKGHSPDSPISIAVTSQATGMTDNALVVFLEKFWSIEDDIHSVLRTVDGLEELIEEKIDNATKHIISELEDNNA